MSNSAADTSADQTPYDGVDSVEWKSMVERGSPANELAMEPPTVLVMPRASSTRTTDTATAIGSIDAVIAEAASRFPERLYAQGPGPA